MSGALPCILGDRYRVLRLLGRGGMGVVYEVEHEHTGDHFALKVLADRSLASASAVARFRREARVWARIRSEHVVRVIDAGTAPELDGAPYLVMELLDGENLALACGDVPQPAARVVDWLRQAAAALDKAHALGIVHRDLKPENLFLTRPRDVDRAGDAIPVLKVLDFGLAKVALEAGATTTPDAILGTPLFMAPEQADPRAGPITRQADLFALGVIAHKLLTGQNYWRAAALVQLVREVCLDPMPPPSERGSTQGAAFDAWFSRACHRDPSQRFASAGEQVDALAVSLGMGRRFDTHPSVSPVIFDLGARTRAALRVPRGVLVAVAGVGAVVVAGVTGRAGSLQQNQTSSTATAVSGMATPTASRHETPLTSTSSSAFSSARETPAAIPALPATAPARAATSLTPRVATTAPAPTRNLTAARSSPPASVLLPAATDAPASVRPIEHTDPAPAPTSSTEHLARPRDPWADQK